MDFVENYSLVLENKANAARDHMANERTFLSWVRTGFVLATVGVAFMQMYSIQSRAREVIYENLAYGMAVDTRIDALHEIGRPLGFLTGIFSILVILFGFTRYLATQRSLQRQRFPATRVMVVLVVVFSTVVLALILAIEIRTT